ncbi:CXXC-type zinc finger protein 1 [Geodia barretti]|uniref:CXXC-type zinc finger protein 1 n=1 Tax=Geodia barretti TaxID=519541 RepID=A0AA35RZL8_GEOBA|nr:CXXC-type zinc finger protein 1 [Geodia barretti]
MLAVVCRTLGPHSNRKFSVLVFAAMEEEAEDSKPVRKMVEYYIDSTSDEESSEEDDGTEATLTAEEGPESVTVRDEEGVVVEKELECGEGEREDAEKIGGDIPPFGDFGGGLEDLGMGESEGFHLYERDEQELIEVDMEDLSSPVGSLSPSWAEPGKDATAVESVGEPLKKKEKKEDDEEEEKEWKLKIDVDSDGGDSATVSLTCSESFRPVKETLSVTPKARDPKLEDRNTSTALLRPSTHPSAPYCFCQQPALNYFMIQCHKCSGWFHGSCVGITRHQASRVKEFYCSLCIDADPSLVTVFHEKNVAVEDEEEDGYREKEKRGAKSRTSYGESGSKRPTAKKHSRRCGACAACLCEEDCKKCRFCKDMPKYGGLGRMRQKCIKRQCHKLSRILYAEDPLHSKSRKLHEDIAAELKKVGGRVVLSSTSEGEGTYKDAEEASKSVRFAEEDLGSSIAPKTAAKSRHRGKKKPAKRLGGGGGGGGRSGRSVAKGSRGRVRLSASDLEIITQEQPVLRRRGRRGVLLHGSSSDRDLAPVQCLGPGCVYAARPHSKYCSEECGIQLAIRRIKALLPESQKWWEDEDGGNKRTTRALSQFKLQELEKEQKDLKAQLEELDVQTQSIDSHVSSLASATPSGEDEGLEGDDDLTIFCATCGRPTGIKKAVHHMERCFSKMEGVVSFGSLVKSEGYVLMLRQFMQL